MFFFRINPTPKIDKYGMCVGPQGSLGLEGGNPSVFLSKRTTHTKKIQNTVHKEKYSKRLVPQVCHRPEGGNPLGESCESAPFKKKTKGIEGKDAICVGLRLDIDRKGEIP